MSNFNMQSPSDVIDNVDLFNSLDITLSNGTLQNNDFDAFGRPQDGNIGGHNDGQSQSIEQLLLQAESFRYEPTLGASLSSTTTSSSSLNQTSQIVTRSITAPHHDVPFIAAEDRKTTTEASKSAVRQQSMFLTFQTTPDIKTTSESSAYSSSLIHSSTKRPARFREPIFVTESPQNAYKKKNKKNRTKSSPSSTTSSLSNEEDEGGDSDDHDESNQMKQLTSKERRQLRNKISARNFRVRRKEYIEHLESRVREQDKELVLLRQTNARLQKINENLAKEVQHWRQLMATGVNPSNNNNSNAQYPTPLDGGSYMPDIALNNTAPASSSESSHSPDTDASLSMQVAGPGAAAMNDIFPLFGLQFVQDFDLFDFSANNESHLAHAVIPDFDFLRVLGDKIPKPNEDHVVDKEGNVVLKPAEFMKTYPLFIPAIISMIVRHTFTLEYASYISNALLTDITPNTLKYSSSTQPRNWFGLFDVAQSACLVPDSDEDEQTLVGVPCMEEVLGAGSDSKCYDDPSRTTSQDNDRGVPLTEEEAKALEDKEVERLIKEHYLHYAFLRMAGYTHEQVFEKYRQCMREGYRRCSSATRRKYMAAGQARPKQSRRNQLTQSLSTIAAFCSVSNTVLHHPERLPFIAAVLKNNRRTKSFAKLPFPIITPASKESHATSPSFLTFRSRRPKASTSAY